MDNSAGKRRGWGTGIFFGILALLGGMTSCDDEAPAAEDPVGSASEPNTPKVGASADPAGRKAEAKAVPTDAATHLEVVQRLYELKMDFLMGLDGLSHPDGAEKFVAGLDKRKSQIGALLEKARALPAAGPEAKALYLKHQEQLGDQSAVVMADLGEKLRDLPEGGEVERILEVLSQDRQVEALNREFESLYGTSDQ